MTITLLPALPHAWPSGAIKGARIRGGVSLSLSWNNGKPTKAVLSFDKTASPRTIRVIFAGRQVDTFIAVRGSERTITNF